MKTYMTVGIDDTDKTKAGVSISPDLDAATAMQLLGTLALHVLNAYTIVATRDISLNKDLSSTEKDAAVLGIKESIYDAMNNMFSNVLETYYPNAAKYEIEDEAILRLTNQIIEERYKKMPKEARKKYKETYDQIKKRLTDDKARRSSK